MTSGTIVRMTRRLTASIGVACAALLLAAAAPYWVKLDAARCTPASRNDLTSLGPEWVTLEPYAQVCPVHGPDGQVALSVAIVRLDRAYKAHYFGTAHRSQTVPPALVRLPDGAVIGDLGEQFPTDPPGRMKVTFTDWRNNWPRRIDRYEAGESALPPHGLDPLRWDAGAGVYRIDAQGQ